MKTFFSTSDVHPRHRFDYWRSVACKNIVDHDSVADCPQAFHAKLRSGGLGEMTLVSFENSPMAISHTKRQAARADSKEIFICRQFAAALKLEQNGRQTRLDPGDITLLDPRLPYSGEFLPGAEMLVLKAPRALVEARVGSTWDMMAYSIRPPGGEIALLSAYLAALPSCVDTLDRAAQQIAQDHVIDLLGMSLLVATHRSRPGVSSARMIALLKIRAAIEARLSDPALNAATVAVAAGISQRYANTVLSGEGTSLRRLIFTRRLARCRSALEDPLQRHRTVSDIAYRWGFSDMTHFGRAFRAAYGLLPSEFRKLNAERR
jgi:AraC family transcriptional activator of tynA and feaB